MTRIVLIAMLIVVSSSAARADQYGRFTRARGSAVSQTRVASQDGVADAAPSPVPEAVESHGAHGAFLPGYAWVNCCRGGEPCCMNLWDNYCSQREKHCYVPRCHHSAKRYRCGSCNQGHGCSTGCNSSRGRSRLTWNRHRPCATSCAAQNCSAMTGTKADAGQAQDDVPPQPTEIQTPKSFWDKSASMQNVKWRSATGWKW